MDSLVVDPLDARMQFATMLVERIDALEAGQMALSAENASLRDEVAGLREALEAQPRPQAYYFELHVPAGTTRQQAEEGLKAAWATHQLKVDGVYHTGFCAALTHGEAEATGGPRSAWVHVFVFGVRRLLPHQATAWVEAAVPGCKPVAFQPRNGRCIWYDVEVEFFRSQLRGHVAWVLADGAWVAKTMLDVWMFSEEDAARAEEWMETAYMGGVPWVAQDGGSH